MINDTGSIIVCPIAGMPDIVSSYFDVGAARNSFKCPRHRRRLQPGKVIVIQLRALHGQPFVGPALGS
jgi:hypothetical protein